MGQIERMPERVSAACNLPVGHGERTWCGVVTFNYLELGLHHSSVASQ